MPDEAQIRAAAQQEFGGDKAFQITVVVPVDNEVNDHDALREAVLGYFGSHGYHVKFTECTVTPFSAERHACTGGPFPLWQTWANNADPPAAAWTAGAFPAPND